MALPFRCMRSTSRACVNIFKNGQLNSLFKSSSFGSTSSEGTTTDEKKEPPVKEEIEDAWKEEKETLIKEKAELKDKYLRSMAETVNLRQSFQHQIEEAKLFGIQGFCKDLVDFSDVLLKATTSLGEDELKNQNNQALTTLFEGVKMAEGQLNKIFKKHGLVMINPSIGDEFDPNYHEALFTQPIQVDASPASTPGAIASVGKIGFRLHDRTIRPAIVGIFK